MAYDPAELVPNPYSVVAGVADFRFNPGQPRHPAGTRYGGRFLSLHDGVTRG